MKNSHISLVLVFSAVWAYLCVWALIKPPFQSPDEFAHLSRTLGIPSDPWLSSRATVTASARSVNPILFQPQLHSVPFHFEQKFNGNDIRGLKMLDWDRSQTSPPVELATTAINYPAPFYIVAYILGESVSRVLDLSPYGSLYAYRIVVSGASSLLWTLVFSILSTSGLKEARYSILACIVLNPMLAFISSSINPDALFLPLATLSILLASRTILEFRSALLTIFVITITCLTKPAGLLLLPAIGLAGGLVALYRLITKSNWITTLLLSGFSVFTPFLLAYISFYHWVPSGPGDRLPPLPLDAYLTHIHLSSWNLFIGSWGTLGWLDYNTSAIYYKLVGWSLLLNLILFIGFFVTLKARLAKSFFLAVGLLHPICLFVMEFKMYPLVGLLMQGRYFLPGIIGVMVVFTHPQRWARVIMVLSIIILSAALLKRTVDRYYHGRWRMVYYAIPGVEIPERPLRHPIVPTIEESEVPGSPMLNNLGR